MGKVGGGKEKGIPRSNISSILKYLTAKEKSKKDGKAEIVSGMQSLIVAAMLVNSVPSVPSINNMKPTIGRNESMNSSQMKEHKDLDDAETLAAGASAATDFMERMMDMPLKRASGKEKKSVRKLFLTSTSNRFG